MGRINANNVNAFDFSNSNAIGILQSNLGINPPTGKFDTATAQATRAALSAHRLDEETVGAIQKAVGAHVDGDAGTETMRKFDGFVAQQNVRSTNRAPENTVMGELRADLNKNAGHLAVSQRRRVAGDSFLKTEYAQRHSATEAPSPASTASQETVVLFPANSVTGALNIGPWNDTKNLAAGVRGGFPQTASFGSPHAPLVGASAPSATTSSAQKTEKPSFWQMAKKGLSPFSGNDGGGG